jgi:hypothetical protein
MISGRWSWVGVRARARMGVVVMLLRLLCPCWLKVVVVEQD